MHKDTERLMRYKRNRWRHPVSSGGIEKHQENSQFWRKTKGILTLRSTCYKKLTGKVRGVRVQ